jgi:uncharacterized protein (DUF1501 family)
VRGNLALAKDTLLQITPSNLGGRTLGIHPSMPEVRDLFNAGNVAFVSNVGSLVRPTTLTDYKAGRYRPVSLYSHSDQIKQWQTCMPDKRTAVGWGGRAADIINSLNGQGMVSMNISLSGQNTFLTGQQAFNYSVGSGGATALSGYDPLANRTTSLNGVRSSAADSMLAADYQSLFEKSFAGSTLDAVETYYEFTSAITPDALTAVAPTGNSLASNLRMIARIADAAKKGKLQNRRQVFFVQYGGWDHHDEVINNQQTMLGIVSKALGFFWTALGELGLRDNVTLFTASDFGRTLTSNGNGSDHAWGANHLAMGGAVAGGNVLGNRDLGSYPDLQNLSLIDTGQGRLIPGVAVDEYARDLLSWFGISNTDMDYVLPSYSTRFAGRMQLGVIGPSAPPAATTPAPSPATTPAAPATSSGGGGGGSLGIVSTGAAGALLVLKKLADRKRRLEAERKAAALPEKTTEA